MKINFLEKRALVAYIVFCSLLVIVGLAVTVLYLKRELPTVPVALPTDETPAISAPAVKTNVIGQSVEKRDIVVHTFGSGPKQILFVGGVHGGYEWNSVMLAEAMINYFTDNLDTIPENLTVAVIPVLNPDGLAIVANGKTADLTTTDITNWSNDGRGRFNAHNVDLNRNFDCKWKSEATWRSKNISAGTSAFSEPEAKALRDYVTTTSPSAVVFWHSVAGAVYASECEGGILSTTLDIMNTYAEAGQYGAVPIFDAYPITGDAEGWLASIGIPAITVELETRESIEWVRNLAGTKSILTYFSTQNE